MDATLHTRRRRRTATMLVAALALFSAPALAQDRGSGGEGVLATPPAVVPTAQATDGPVYAIGRLTLRYLRENPLQPDVNDIMQATVDLVPTRDGWIAPRDEFEVTTRTLAEISAAPTDRYYASALQRILESIRDYLVDEADLLGVYVAPDPSLIRNGMDQRGPDEPDLTILITTGIVSELRTVASGDRVGEGKSIDPGDRIDNPAHRRILERSPVKPYAEGDEERSDLLRKSELDRYLFWLGRHPGRRVDASISVAEDVGAIGLDYLVTENRPLALYLQASNTGTASTEKWRQRFGLLHNQLTGRDDILSLEFGTASFTDTNVFLASYEAPFPDDRIRWKAYGLWSQYTAEDVGFVNNIFEGDQWALGGEVIANVYQQRELFVDVIGGMRYTDIGVSNDLFLIDGQEQFLIPYVGARLDRTTAWFSTRAQVTLDFQFGDVTDVNLGELVSLGRTNPDTDFQILRWDVSHSVFLEPLLDRAAWKDPSTPESSTLAHEIKLQFRGQYAFDNRLIPQFQQTVGGLYTVRGFPEAAVAGDSAVIANAEYRYHLPRAFKIQAEPQELFGTAFRTAPQYVYGLPDWDLILKGFLDVGAVWQSQKLFFENDDTLVGAGIGLDFIYRRNLTLRLDWGIALTELESRNVQPGDSRLHFVATILF